MPGPDSKYEKAPYMGQISAHRIHGGGMSLYGSPIVHDEAIAITIQESEVNNDLGRSWYSSRETIAEVYLSPAQWADFLTRLNVGGGVPCTFRYKRGEGYVNPGQIPTPDPIRFNDGSDKEMLDLTQRWSELESMVDKMLEKGSASKTDLKNLKQRFTWHRNSAKGTFDFLTKCLIERAEAVVSAVKHEIVAITENTGLRWIQQQIKEGRQIEEGNKPKELE